MSDFFLYGNYFTNNQIKAINELKKKKIIFPDEFVNGDCNSIFDDINAYRNDRTTVTNNTSLFEYIEDSVGMDNFLTLLDIDGDGKISKEETEKLSNYDGNKELNSSDIDNIFKDIKNLSGAKSVSKGDKTTTEYTYTTDASGNLVKTSAVKKTIKQTK